MAKKTWTQDQVIEYFEGIPALADLLGCSRQAIYLWKGTIPKARALDIEFLSKGHIKAVDLPTDESKRKKRAVQLAKREVKNAERVLAQKRENLGNAQ